PLALLVAFSRVYNGVHYPSDVLVGGILGAGYAVAFVTAINVAWRWIGKKWFSVWLEKMPLLVSARPAIPSTQSAIVNRQSEIEKHWLCAGYVLIVVLTLARWFYVASGTIELS